MRTLAGDPVAESIHDHVEDGLTALARAGVTPTLATVLMSDVPADQRFMERKHEACERLGVESVDRRLDPAAPATDCYDAVASLDADPTVDALFVQVPLPEHVSEFRVRTEMSPSKDIDCFNPATLGKSLEGAFPVGPVTPSAVVELLDYYDVATAGVDATVVGRSPAIGRPLANLLFDDRPRGNATVTVCHTSTRNLRAKTRRADLLVTACGEAHLLGADAVGAGATVVDVSANRIETTDGAELVGDVDHEAVRGTVAAMTPVPGGVGPVTMASFLDNVVTLARERHGV
jgi:methylenetetrahydrofolate dehydrogenase (NADP+)/methenyltetrahydrofolate cyclohydrolase